MSVFVLNMTTMIGLGVGIDYSLLVVTRFREELGRGLPRREAAIATMVTAGEAVITSGLTVVVGFGALLLTPAIETRSVGLGGLIVVAVAVLLSVTLLPALLALLGREIDRPRWMARRLAWYHAPQVWEKWARTLSRHPIRAMGYGGITIALLTLPVFWIRIGLPSRHWWPNGTEAGRGLDVLSRMGVAGYIQPIRILVEAPERRTMTQAQSLRGLRVLSDSLRADPRVREVRSLVDLEPGQSLLAYSVLYSDLESARREYPDFLDAYLSSDRRLTLMDVILSDTTSLTSAQHVVVRARALARTPLRSTRGLDIKVGGYAAAAYDFQEDLLALFPELVGLILAATVIMLALAFRSVLVPIKAIIMNTLSVSATFGLIVLVFQLGFGSSVFGLDGPTSAVFVVVPVLVFAVVFGLSMDYEVFLLSRIKEAYDRSGRNTQATMEGLSATASVITSAALIMILVFGIFAFARVLVMQLLGLRARRGGPARRHGHPDGAGAGLHAGDGTVELVAGGRRGGAGQAARPGHAGRVGQRRSSVRTIVRPTRDSSPARLTSPQPSSTMSSMRPASARAPIPRRRSPTSATGSASGTRFPRFTISQACRRSAGSSGSSVGSGGSGARPAPGGR